MVMTPVRNTHNTNYVDIFNHLKRFWKCKSNQEIQIDFTIYLQLYFTIWKQNWDSREKE